MSLIKSLTSEQQASLPTFRSAWFAYGTSTKRADRTRAEAAILAMRSEIGVQTRPVFLWCQSPASSLLAIHLLKSEQWRALVRNTRSCTIESPGASLGDSLRASLGDSLRASLGDSLRASLWDSLHASLWDSLRASLWASLGASLGVSLHASLWDSLHASLGASLGVSLHASLWDSLRASLGDSLRASLWASLGDSLRASLWDSLRASLWASLGDSLHAWLWDSLGDSWWGQHESYWVAFYLFCRDVVGVQYDAKHSRQLDMWRDLAQSCCWWWCHENYVVVSERPTVCRMTESEGRLHCADGPALAFADGYALYRWHGVAVPEDVIVRPESITVSHIDSESNAEVRRVLLERFGEAKYLVESGTTQVHADSYGTLYRKEIAGDEPLVMVRVVNSTAEPDGSRKPYFLRVPPTIETAREAVAWTFGVETKDYKPIAES